MATVVAQRKSNERLIEYRKLETEMQKLWKESKIFEVDADDCDNLESSTEKFFATFPYPYMNGKLHLGHSFSISKVEFAIAYQRLLGKKCLFPLGFHCTGMPILACADKLKHEIELYGNPPKFPQHDVEQTEEGDNAAKPDIDDIMAKDKSRAKKSKVQAKSGGAKYQWEIMRDNIKLSDEDLENLSEAEVTAKIDREIAKFVDPTYWFKYFPLEAIEDLNAFGLGIDWRRTFITTDVNPFYDSFVRWQFLQLRKKNKIKYGKRYSIYSPKDGQPCMDHDRATGEGVQPQEYTLIKIKLLGKITKLSHSVGIQPVYLLAATLRPETMYGQTNLWLKPEIKYVAFKMINNEVGICTYRAALNMSYQDLTPKVGQLEILAEIEGHEIFGQPLESPLAYNKMIYALPMMTIKDDKGTGVVTSVPSDSPDDYIALCDLKNKPALREKYNIKDNMVLPFEPIPIIDVEEFGNLSAVKVCNKYKIQSQNDREKLAEAKEEVYKKGFYDGKMLVPEYFGKKVNEVRKPVQEILIKNNQAILYMEPEKQVISRSNDECVVALCDQWYLDYEDEAWKNQVRGCLKNLETYSDQTKNRFEETINWLHGHACSRTYGLGTKLPWDEKWLIESLSDSTIYMAYYTIVHILQGGHLIGSDTTSPAGVKPEQMSIHVWDYVFFGDESNIDKITIPRGTLKKMRKEFLYWYPMDLRSSGKDLVQNHLTYSLYNHCAIWDREPDKWPRSFRANGHLQLNGQKMSKSTGNFLTLQSAIELYSADAVRYALADSGDGYEDANFVDNQAETGLLKLYNFLKWCEETLNSLPQLRQDEEIASFADRSFDNAMNKLISETKEQYDKMMFREALRLGFFEYQELRTKYKELCGSNNLHGPLIRKFIETQAILLNPICPHICQKIWQLLGNQGFIAKTKWPKISKEIDENLHESYLYLNESVHEFRVKLRSFMTPPKSKKGQANPTAVQKASRAIICIAKNSPPWQQTICDKLQDLYIQNDCLPDNKIIASELAKCDSLKKHMKKVMPFVEYRKQFYSRKQFNLLLPFDEGKVLEENMSYLISTLDIPNITIKDVDETDDPRTIEDCCPGRPLITFFSG